MLVPINDIKKFSLRQLLETADDRFDLAKEYARVALETEGGINEVEQLMPISELHVRYKNNTKVGLETKFKILECIRAMQDVEIGARRDAELEALQQKFDDFQKHVATSDDLRRTREEKKKTTADYLNARGKLHMRGLLEYAEKKRNEDKAFQTIVEEALKEKNEEANRKKQTKKIEESPESKEAKQPIFFSRKERWIIMLKMPEHENFFTNLQTACKVDKLEKVDEFGEAISKLHNKLSKSIHKELNDNILDASNTNGGHVIIDADSVGMPEARILECIGDYFNVPYITYARSQPLL